MEEINLYKLLGFYVRNWLLILSLTLAGLGAGLIYNQFIQTPMYKSDSTLLFINPSGSSVQDATRLSNYVELFQSRRVLGPVIAIKAPEVSYEALRDNVGASNDKGTDVIRLSVSTDSASLSQELLRTAVLKFKEEAKELYGSDNLIIVDDASDAEPPYNVKKISQLAIASALGFVVSLLVLFFIYDARGGKVDDWGKKKSRATKAQPAPRTKARKVPTVETAVSVASTTRQRTGVSATVANLWKKFTTSAKNSLWIEETDHDAPSRDDTKG